MATACYFLYATQKKKKKKSCWACQIEADRAVEFEQLDSCCELLASRKSLSQTCSVAPVGQAQPMHTCRQVSSSDTQRRGALCAIVCQENAQVSGQGKHDL